MGYTLFISTQTQLSIDSWHKFSCEVNTHESLDAFTCKVRSLEKKEIKWPFGTSWMNPQEGVTIGNHPTPNQNFTSVSVGGAISKSAYQPSFCSELHFICWHLGQGRLKLVKGKATSCIDAGPRIYVSMIQIHYTQVLSSRTATQAGLTRTHNRHVWY